MSQTPETDPPPKRGASVTLGAVFSLLIGGLALILGVAGLMGKGGSADLSTALPNLITGVASIAGAIGYLALKKRAIPIYAVAVVGHFISHGTLLMAHSAAGHLTPPKIVSLLFAPVLSLMILTNMAQQQKRGLLT